MLGWGSWANTQKLAGKDRWSFELFYWDYAIGVFVFSVLFAFTLGSFGASGIPFLENLRGASSSAIWTAILSGVLFNISNILLVVGIDAAGMAVAFPVGVGLALVIGTVKSCAVWAQPKRKGLQRVIDCRRGLHRGRDDHVRRGPPAFRSGREGQNNARFGLFRDSRLSNGFLLS